MANIPKVPEHQFKAVIRALLNTPPMPMVEIPRKRDRGGRKRKSETKPKKRPPLIGTRFS